MPGQRPGQHQQFAGRIQAPIHYLSQGRRGARSGEIFNPAAGFVHPALRQVYPVQGSVVVRAILQMIEHLQRVAEGVGRGVRAGRLTVQVHQVAPHGGRREIAIADQIVPVVVAQLGCVLLERARQVNAMPVRDSGLPEAAADIVRLLQSGVAAAVSRYGPREPVQAPNFFLRLKVGIVGDIVDRARVGIKGRNMPAQPCGQQPRADRESSRPPLPLPEGRSTAETRCSSFSRFRPCAWRIASIGSAIPARCRYDGNIMRFQTTNGPYKLRG